LRAAGIEFDVMPTNADETVRPGEAADAYVRRVAEAKALAVLQHAKGRPVLAADTVVVLDGAILGKPIDRDDAKRMLRMLSGRAHEVMTGVSLSRGPQGSGPHVQTQVETTTVELAPLTDDDITWYAATGEPDDKAGAYAIQGYASRFVTRITGSYSNVVGLPVAMVIEMLKDAGLLTPAPPIPFDPRAPQGLS
jgi:septum formation protein